MEEQNLVEMRGITKRFGGVQALKGVNLCLKAGKVHALMGENGAGKSTLMKILLGIYQPDEGKIFCQGREIKLNSPAEGLAAGFSMVSQELMQMEGMTVADNIFMGRYPGNVTVGKKTIFRDTENILSDLGIRGIRAGAKIGDLSPAQKQLVEIAKAVSYNAKVIVMDEPTSSLMDHEIEILFQIIRDLKSSGKAIVYISHKMEEIFQICDEITVLRDGEWIGSKQAAELDNDKLVQMMVGRELKELFAKSYAEAGDVALEVRNLSCRGSFEDISFQVRRGEVVGFAGLMGAGRSEIMETIFGIRKKSGGEIFVGGKETDIKNPRQAIRNKIAFVTEDRKGTGLFLNLSILFNSSISALDILNTGKTANRSREKKAVSAMSDSLRLKRGSLSLPASSLSGGNQQKVVLCKWLLTEPDILILDEPTRGIDIGAKKEIYKIIDDLAKAGKAIIVVSSEMPEIIGVSDRVLVIHEGRLCGEIARSELSQEKIMSYMT